MKEWFMKIANVFAWSIGIIIVLFLITSGLYFAWGWHKKRGKGATGEGTVDNPNDKSDKLHVDEIADAINTMWGSKNPK